MLELAGEVADGAALNWCSAEQVASSRARIAAGEKRAGRAPGTTRLAEYVRICVDDDEEAARRAFTRALLGYARDGGGEAGRARLGYRAHFERMGFGEALNQLDALEARGASEEALIDAFPPELALRVGYFGKPAGARRAFLALADGLDVAIVRVVSTRPGLAATLLALEACRG
jgi:alkanesulfonate monooxygenase SsuD/methylene tetrahydromethanopterin reductase-like flavin-dependent oxidoreductase (luciferase family)